MVTVHTTVAITMATVEAVMVEAPMSVPVMKGMITTMAVQAVDTSSGLTVIIAITTITTDTIQIANVSHARDLSHRRTEDTQMEAMATDQGMVITEMSQVHRETATHREASNKCHTKRSPRRPDQEVRATV